jgi:tetratricopeptide (TPR) repeat protein
VTRARALGYQPLLARALTQAARLEQQASRRAAEGEALARAARLLEEAATVAERGRADLRRAIALRDLMMVNLQRGEPRAAELYSQLASAALDRLGDPPEERAAYLLNEGWRKRTFRVGDGGADFRRSLELRRRVLAENDPDLVPSLIAVCLDEQAGAARSCHRRALDTARNALGPSHVYIGHIYVNLAAALKRDPATATEACDLLSQASAIYELAGDRERASAVGARADLATCLRDTGRVAEARAIYDRLLASEPAPSAQRARIHQTYGRFLADQGEREPAVRHLKAALSEGRQHTGECSDTVIETVTSLGAALRSLGRAAEALEQLSQTASACERSGGEPLNLATLYHALGTTLAGRRRPGEAVDALTRALDLHSHAAAPAATVAETELALALALVAQPDPRPGDHARACALAEQALTRQRGGKPSEEMVATARWLTRRCPASVRKRARARTTPPPGCRRWSPGGVLSSSSICRCRRRASRSA